MYICTVIVYDTYTMLYLFFSCTYIYTKVYSHCSNFSNSDLFQNKREKP